MIVSIVHKGLLDFATTYSKKGINPQHSTRLINLLAFLNDVDNLEDIQTHPKYRHELQGEYQGYHSMTVSGNWRLIFQYENGNIYLLDYLDYH